jgi:cell volume regulation protein A
VLPRGFFLVVGLVYLLALGLERLCHRQRIPGAVAILLFGLALQLLVGRAPGINALHVESLHRISLAMLVFVAGLGTNLRRIRGVFAPAAGLCLIVPLLVWLAVGAGLLALGVPLAAAALAATCLLANDSTALEDLLEAADRSVSGRLRHLLQFECAISTLVALFGFAFLAALSLDLHNAHQDLHPALLTTLPVELSGLLQHLGAGAAAGSLVGVVAPRLARSLVRAQRQQMLLAIGFAFVAYGLGQQLGGGGLIAVFVAGVWIANGPAWPERRTATAWQQVMDPFNTAAELTILLLLGLLTEPQLLGGLWPTALLISAIISLVRLLAVPLLLGRSVLPQQDRRIAAATAVPGAVAIALAVGLVEELPHLSALNGAAAEALGRELLAMVFLVVLFSQVLRSLWLQVLLKPEQT